MTSTPPGLLAQIEELRDQRDTARDLAAAYEEELAQQKPVIDAALAWVRYRTGLGPLLNAAYDLRDALDAAAYTEALLQIEPAHTDPYTRGM